MAERFWQPIQQAGFQGFLHWAPTCSWPDRASVERTPWQLQSSHAIEPQRVWSDLQGICGHKVPRTLRLLPRAASRNGFSKQTCGIWPLELLHRGLQSARWFCQSWWNGCRQYLPHAQRCVPQDACVCLLLEFIYKFWVSRYFKGANWLNKQSLGLGIVSCWFAVCCCYALALAAIVAVRDPRLQD